MHARDTNLGDTRRGCVYRMLRDAGDRGVSAAEFFDAGIATAYVHIESLVYEGHTIVKHELAVRDRPGNREIACRWTMTRDAWA